MDKKTKDGYIAGILCLMVFAIFLIMTINTGWNQTGQVMGVFTIIFGGLGFGSLWKPNTIGKITSQLLENAARNMEEEHSSSKQEQKNSPKAIQVSATKGSNVNINVSSQSEEDEDN